MIAEAGEKMFIRFHAAGMNAAAVLITFCLVGYTLAAIELPQPNKKYFIKESGWACDKKYTAECGTSLYKQYEKGYTYVKMKYMEPYFSLNHNPATKWQFEKQADGSYKIYNTYTDRIYNAEKGTSTPVDHIRYWTAINSSGIDYLLLGLDDDNGDTWRLEEHPSRPGEILIYLNKNCDRGEYVWPCGQIVTWYKTYLKLDNGWEAENQTPYTLEETVEVHEKYL